MTDRPIIFSAPMVKALLNGRKRQTRRIIPDGSVYEDISSEAAEDFELRGWDIFSRGEALCAAQVRWDVGDQLWVRERGWLSQSKLAFEPFAGNEALLAPLSPDGTPYKACPSIHMPRWASRLTLVVTDVRVERLQDISEADARAEGAMLHVPCKSAVAGTTIASDSWHFDQDLNGRLYEDTTARGAFEILWGKINGWKSWDANPWVAAISFTVHRANIDALDIGATP